jgi:hypothetical protein
MQPVYRQRIGKHVPTATNTNVTIELLLKTVFITRSVQSGYDEDNWGGPVSFPRCTPARDLHTAFNLPYVCDYIIKLCRQQAEVIRNHGNEHVRGIGHGETTHRKYKRLKLGGGQAYDRSSCRCSIRYVR